MPNRYMGLVKSLAVGAVLLVTAFGISGNAHADEPQPTPEGKTSIVYMDDQPLSVDLAWLKAQEVPGALPVRIRNNTQVTQTVELSLEGLVPRQGVVDPALLSLSLSPTDTQVLGPGMVGELTLKFEVDNAVFTETVSQQGQLVATSFPGGDVIRRDFTLSIQAEPVGDQAFQPSTIIVSEQMTSLTLTGVNFLPSLISPFTQALVFISIALLGLALFARWLDKKWPPDNQGSPLGQGWVPVLAGIVLSIGIVLMILEYSGLTEPWEPSLVHVKPIVVPADAQVGPITADNAQAQMERDEKSVGDVVRVRGIPRAGKYTGTIDLSPEDENKGKVDVTVDVTDWWPYALLTIALGVGVGHITVSYFSQKRPTLQVLQRAAELYAEIRDYDKTFKDEHVNKPFARYSMLTMATYAVQKVEKKARTGLTTESIKDAIEGLQKLEDYRDRFTQFLDQVVDLDMLNGKIKVLLCQKEFRFLHEPPPISEPAAIKQADELLEGRAFRNSDEIREPDESELGTQTHQVSELRPRLEALQDGLFTLRDCFSEINKFPGDNAAQELKGKLEPITRDVLTAHSSEKVVDKVTEAQEEYNKWQPSRQPEGWRPAVAPAVAPERDITQEGASQRLQETLQKSDLLMTSITGLLAVGTGFATLYSNADVITWGTPHDYLYAFLWGAGVAEGTKFALKLVDRLAGNTGLPASGPETV